MAKNGKKQWFMPDAFYPVADHGDYVSHEAVCVLNTGDEDAHIDLTLYFEDREPRSGFHAVCGARRTNHIRLDKLKDESGEGIDRGVPYAILLDSDVPVVVQYSRCDTTQSELSFMGLLAY
ncbi:MAG: hypothetical protein J5950_08040 [Clostridia bacterium]|nr:hypothetical protein [Clostridia bacterium]